MSVIDKRKSERIRPIVTVPHTYDGQGLVTIREGKRSKPGDLQMTVRTHGGGTCPALRLDDLVMSIGEAFDAKVTLTLEEKESDHG